MALVIAKSNRKPIPRLDDYDRLRTTFTWSDAEKQLDWMAGGGLNIAHEAVDRHAKGVRANRVALRWLGKNGEVRDYSYADLALTTNRFANALRDLGVGSGDRLFVLAGRLPELYISAIGTLKNRCVFSPLFSAFGPEPIISRINLGSGRVLVTTEALYKKKVAPHRDKMPTLEHVILIGRNGSTTSVEGTHDFSSLMAMSSDKFEIEATDPEEMALLHFTSGTTGTPKGAVHVHRAVLAHHITGQFALDFHDEDVFWCTADPGWVTGTSYGIIAPLTSGITSIIDEAEFDARRWYQILQDQKVNVWYTAPTAVRMLMRVGSGEAKNYDLSALRFLASVGEPLNPEAVVWGQETFGLPFHDNWWQSETGGIMIANYASMDVRPGSMGKPLPGIDAAIVSLDESRNLTVIEEPNVEGELALRKGWPSMFRGYLNEEARYEKCFSGEWYLTGDLARCDEDGYFWFVGRADDVIKSAGHLIGPFEVESALMEHEAVAEVAVIGKPDPIAMNIVKAFVSLQPGTHASEALRKELAGFARKRLGPAVAPKEIEFSEQLPKTRSGKIMRRLLRARELGLPEGDTSTLEQSE
jgi:acetyl-CoA synthetase